MTGVTMIFPWYWVIELVGGLGIAAVFAWVWIQLHREERRIWKCIRSHGGGLLVTPKAMTVFEVTRWIGQTNNGEVTYVDNGHGFIFYKPRGG